MWAIWSILDDDETAPFFGSFFECLEHCAWRNRGEFHPRGCVVRYELLFSESAWLELDRLLARLELPDFWMFMPVEHWALLQLPPDHPEVMAAFRRDQGDHAIWKLQADAEGWIEDWLMNGDLMMGGEYRLSNSVPALMNMAENLGFVRKHI